MDENLRTVGVAVSGRFRIAVTSLLEAASLEFERQRFEQWATNMGLYKPGDVSLDYILRDAPSVQNYAREPLESLKSSLIAGTWFNPRAQAQEPYVYIYIMFYCWHRS